MIRWAEAQWPPVTIDRGVFITQASLRDILALRFNPGNTTAELSTAEQGISILMCRHCSSERKSALRQKELTEGRASKNNLSLADAEKLTQPLEPTVCPETYDELHRCLGTFCALLHTLFGSRCMFLKQCFVLLRTMESDRVSDRRENFTPLFCRQVIWAILEDGRDYFSSQLTPDDFIGVHPDDISYPDSNVIEIKTLLRWSLPLFNFVFKAVKKL